MSRIKNLLKINRIRIRITNEPLLIRNYSLQTSKTHPKTLHNPTFKNSYPLRFSQTKTKVLRCWKCGIDKKLITDLFCDKCNVIQEPFDTNNYFNILGIEESFNVDAETLSKSYRSLQTVLHPDKFSNKTEEEKKISAEYSSLVNKAYKSLQSPLTRALHMLTLRGEKMEDNSITDPSFLMTIMEINEEVAAAETPEKLKDLDEKNRRTLRKLEDELAVVFRDNNMEKAKETVIKMKYYNSIKLHINGLLRERGIVD